MPSSMVRLSSCIFSNLQEVAPMNQPEKIIVRTADASEEKIVVMAMWSTMMFQQFQF